MLQGLHLWMRFQGLDFGDWPGRAPFVILGPADDRTPLPPTLAPIGTVAGDRRGPGDMRAASEARGQMGGGDR